MSKKRILNFSIVFVMILAMTAQMGLGGIRAYASSPSYPVAAAATSITSTGFTANWNSVSDSTGYILDVATDNAFLNCVAGYNDRSVSNVTSSAVTGLQPNTTYYYQVRGTNGSETSSNSNAITLTTSAAEVTTVVLAGSSLGTAGDCKITNLTSGRKYTVVSGTTTYYVKADGTLSANASDAINLTGTEIKGLTNGTTYYVSILVEVPSPPSILAATSITSTGFTANWLTVSDATGYILDVATNISFSDFVVGYNNKAVSGTAYAVTGLQPNTTYYYRVRGTNGSETSSNSNAITLTTSAAEVTTVVLAGSSLGTAGDCKITNLTSGRKYTVVSGVTYYVKADGTLSANASDVGSLTGTEITGLQNGIDYDVQKISSSSSSSHHSSNSSTSEIKVNITDGSSADSVSQTVISRTTASDGTKKDLVTYTADKAKETIAKLVSERKDVARIVATDSDPAVSETRVNIPRATLSTISSGNVNLEIEAGGAIVSIPKESLQDLYTNGELKEDLYFRLVPINNKSKKEEIKTRANQEAVIKAVSGNNAIQVLGTPMTIETNMGQRTVGIILPLTNITLPKDAAEKEAFLKDLGVFIEHSDGEKVLARGEVVKYASGVLGIKFTVNKFSDFTIVKLNQDVTSNKKTGWNKINGEWYFFDNNTGAMVTGWYKSENRDWIYDGKDTANQWFYLDTDGKMKTGWFKDTDGSWYYLCDGSDYGVLGVVETGWKYIDKEWYYFNTDGVMASNTVVDGYTLDSDGSLK